MGADAPGRGPTESQAAAATPATRRAALTIAALSAFLTPFMGSAVHIALPAIETEFQIGAVRLSWVANAYLLAAAMALVPAGRAADIFGRRRIFIAGNLTFTAASLLCAAAPDVVWLIAARAVQAAGSAMLFATGIAIVTAVYPAHRRGTVLGVNVAAVYAGLSCGPLAGGLLTGWIGWRSVFASVVPLGGLAVYLTWRRLHGEWAEARGEPFDWPGSLAYGAALVALMLGLSRPAGMASLALIGSGLAGLAGFAAWELRSPSPVFEVRLFARSRVFAFSCLAALIHYAATFAVMFLLSIHLQQVEGLSADRAGLVLMCQPVMMALFSPLAGRLSDHIEPRYLSSSGMGLTAAGLVWLTRVEAGGGLGPIMACLVLLGLGFALFSSPNMNAIMGSVARRHYGVAAGAVGTMRLLGQMLSMGIATAIIASRMGPLSTTAAPALFVQSQRLALWTFAVLCVAGSFLSLGRGRLRPGK
jgi:EmrB/QacA subfamily drug resistance transporter